MSKKSKREYDKQYYKNNRERILKRNKQWSKNNRECNRKSVSKHYFANKYIKYGFSHEGWLEMWENQDGKCAICGKSFNKPSDACVDHNHKTGQNRGLLCRKCNFGLGYFNDNLKLMIKAMEYLSLLC